ncbi:MAG: hypothetical protein K2O67_05085, partial [Clostridia bacterium]|nr:hypothetical protein [Clostridia bacterium]
NKREIKVTLSNVEHTYDGKPYNFGSAEEGFEVENTVEGEELACTVTYAEGSPLNAGTYTVEFDTENLTLANGERTENYTLSADSVLECQLKIKKRSIKVEVADRTVQNKTLEYVLANVYGTDDLNSYLADGSGGFGFAESDLNNLGAKFSLSAVQDADEAKGAAAYKITVTFEGATVDVNYNIEVTDGTLLLTDKWVSVTLTVGGEFTYDGNPVDIGAFGIEHIHMPDGAKNSGFTAAELAKLDIEYVFTNVDNPTDVYSNGNTPVDAGDYLVTVVLHAKSGYENDFDNYMIEIHSADFTISRRTVNVKTVNDGGLNEFVYSGSTPAISADIDLSGNSANEGFIGATPAYTLVNMINGEEAERYNAGTYKVDVRFENIGNYDINVTEYFEFTILKRTVVLKPVHPNGGEKIAYAGEALRLGENDFVEAYGTHVQGDTVTISSTVLEPTRINGTVQINGATVKNAAGEDVTDNYELIYDRSGAVKYLPQATIADFRVVMEYEKMTFEYEQVVNGKTFEYDGATHRYDFTGTANEVVKVLNNSLYEGHTITLRANYYTTAAVAGETAGWLNGIIRIKDKNNKDVTILYDFDCKNATAAGKPVIVEKVKVTVTVSGISAAGVTERVTKLTTANYSTTELKENVGVEVYAFNIRGEKSLGVTVFKTQNGSRTDLKNNYEVTIVNNTDVAKAEVLSLTEADNLSLPALDITFLTNITPADLEEGDLFFLDTDGNWKLNAGLYSAEGLEDNHKVEIVVSKVDGAWAVGVAVTGVNAAGSKIDVKSKYNLGQLSQFGGVSVSYVSLSEMNSARKLLYIDFTGAFIDNNDGTYSVNEALISDGKLDTSGFTCTGLKANDNQIVEVSVSDDGNGNYTFTVRVYKENRVAGRVVKIDQYKNYSVTAKIPAGAPATATFAAL